MDTAIIEEEDVENILEEGDDEGSEKINPLDGFTGEEIRNPVKAIRAKCLDCSTYTISEIRNCVIKNCSLYPFRLGKNPFRTVVMTEERKLAASNRCQKMREIRLAKLAEAKVSEVPAKKLRV